MMGARDDGGPAWPISAMPEQKFDTFQQWVDRASYWLTAHPDYFNAEHAETLGWRGHHFAALCFDSKGRRCRNGADFMRARDESAFPVFWIWPDQAIALAADAMLAARQKDSP